MITENIKNLIKPKLDEMEIHLDNVSYEKEGNNYFLRIVIDRDIPIDVDTCVDVTHAISPILDQADLIKESYILDISSKEKGEKQNG